MWSINFFSNLPLLWVVMVSTVSKPTDMRAGTALWSIQKETKDIIQVRVLGM